MAKHSCMSTFFKRRIWCFFFLFRDSRWPSFSTTAAASLLLAVRSGSSLPASAETCPHPPTAPELNSSWSGWQGLVRSKHESMTKISAQYPVLMWHTHGEGIIYPLLELMGWRMGWTAAMSNSDHWGFCVDNQFSPKWFGFMWKRKKSWPCPLKLNS